MPYLRFKKKQHAPKLVGSVANVRITKQPKWEDFIEVTSSYIGSTPPTQDSSHHQDYYIFSRESLETFICHCSWVKGRCNLYKYFGGQGSEAWSWQNCCFGGGGPDGAPPRWGPQGTSKGVKKWRLANLATLGTNMYILFFKAFSKMTFRLSGARNVSVPRRVNCHQTQLTESITRCGPWPLKNPWGKKKWCFIKFLSNIHAFCMPISNLIWIKIYQTWFISITKKHLEGLGRMKERICLQKALPILSFTTPWPPCRPQHNLPRICFQCCLTTGDMENLRKPLALLGWGAPRTLVWVFSPFFWRRCKNGRRKHVRIEFW